MRDKPDFYTQKAKKEGYPARSVYKLEEIQNKYRIIKRGDRILDIGAAPGSWSLFVYRLLKGTGFLVSVDLTTLSVGELINASNVKILKGDIFDLEIMKEIEKESPYSCILSDAAPGTTGNRTVDTQRSLNLVKGILDLSPRILKAGGDLIMKIFQGGEEAEILKEMKTSFNNVKAFKPQASRN